MPPADPPTSMSDQERCIRQQVEADYDHGRNNPSYDREQVNLLLELLDTCRQENERVKAQPLRQQADRLLQEVSTLRKSLKDVNVLQEQTREVNLSLHEKNDVLTAQVGELRAVWKQIIDALWNAYRKHYLGDETIGWNELGDQLHNALCEAIGDAEYNRRITALDRVREEER